jgi:uncharacterized protein (TIGR02246 family)
MKKISVSIALAAALAAFAAPARTAGSPAKDAIEKLNRNWVAAWNAHDAKKMAAMWAQDGDLINPFGRKAANRAEIEKLFVEEQSGVMKASTYKIDSFSVRQLNSATAVGDWESLVTGMVDPAGKALPAFPHHVFIVYVNEGGRWWAASTRAYPSLAAPPAK